MSLPRPEPAKADKAKKMIPEDELIFWIKQNVDTSGANIVKIRDGYLWSKGDIERHRLDIFEKYEVEGEGEFVGLTELQSDVIFCITIGLKRLLLTKRQVA